jgi:hypothetical protein
MKRILSTAGVVLLLAIPALAQNATPNFSGTWTLDVAKSDFGPAPPPDSVVMVVDHKEPTIKTTTTQKSAQAGDTTNVSTLTTDGKENVNKLRAMGGEQDVRSTTKWNGKKLATVRTLEIQGMTINMNDAWELSDDGKVMTIVRTIGTPQGDFTTKMILNKK